MLVFCGSTGLGVSFDLSLPSWPDGLALRAGVLKFSLSCAAAAAWLFLVCLLGDVLALVWGVFSATLSNMVAN